VKRLFPALIPIFVLLLIPAAAAQGANRPREVGGYPALPFPKPGCPDNCQAVGHVTGYQTQIGSVKDPYTVGHPGKVVAFTIGLGKPDAKQTQFFTNLFGGPPSARLSILKLAKTKHNVRLKAQSEVFDLTNYMGSTPTFVLSKPLAVAKGWTIGLTVPTWAPAFAINLGPDQVWRSSRAKNDCDGTSQNAQQTVGTLRMYQCRYRTARLLYSATFIRDPQPTVKPKGAKKANGR
jgi:hypothetical protein